MDTPEPASRRAGRNRRVLPSLVAGTAALLILAGLMLSSCSCLPTRPYASALVLLDIAAQSGPSRWKRVTPPPVVTAIEYHVERRSYRADIYRSAERTRAGILLVPGAAELGKDDPRLVAFAHTLARAGFAVLVPDLPAFRQMQLGRRNIREVADAAAYLASRADLAPGGRAGVAAFSYAVGVAVLAALEPDVRERLRFIVGVGGYYNLERVVGFFTTGYFRDETKPGGEWLFLEPNEYGKWVFVLSNTGRIANPADREVLDTIAKQKADNPAAAVESLVARLGAEGGAYYELVSNKDPQRVPELIERLPAGIKNEISGLDVARHDLSKLKARLILFHGRDDDIIPFTESIALARAAGPPQPALFVVNGLAHVDVQQMGFRDRVRLWCGINALLGEQGR
jgi:acetyl esterase/lipase